MSSLALRVLLERLSTRKEGGSFDNKALKKAVAYRQTHTLIIEKDDLANQFARTLKDEYRLTEQQQQRVREIVEGHWPKLISEAKAKTKSTKDIEIIVEGERLIAQFYGNKSNYYRIDDHFFKPDATYSSIFLGLLNRLKFYLIGEAKKSINKRTDKQGNLILENGKPVDAFAISDLFNQGHYQGSSIHYTIASQFLPTAEDPTNYLQNPDIRKVIETSTVGQAPFNNDVNMLMEAASKITGGVRQTDFKKSITVKIEAKAANQLRGAKEEATIRAEFVKHISNILKKSTAFDWVDQESSDSVITLIEKSLVNSAIDAGAKGTKRNLNTTKGKAVHSALIKSRGIQRKRGVKAKPGTTTTRRAPAVSPSYLSLITLLNERLPPKVRSNMGSPRLNNRTGRLSESARVTNILQTATGLPSIEYTYQRSPYDVFDKTKGRSPWNTPERDPSDLVALSVRQLATELGMRRFYTRRAA